MMERDAEGNPAAYLGDGAYASFDGFAVTVYADRDGIRHWVQLEPEILFMLLRFMKDVGFGELLSKVTP